MQSGVSDGVCLLVDDRTFIAGFFLSFVGNWMFVCLDLGNYRINLLLWNLVLNYILSE